MVHRVSIGRDDVQPCRVDLASAQAVLHVDLIVLSVGAEQAQEHRRPTAQAEAFLLERPREMQLLSHHVVIGEVVGIHIRDDVIGADGKIDIKKVRPLARLGYMDYTSVTEVFTMKAQGNAAGGLGTEAQDPKFTGWTGFEPSPCLLAPLRPWLCPQTLADGGAFL